MSNETPTPITEATTSVIQKTPQEILRELLIENGAVSTIKLKTKLREIGYSEVDSLADELSQEETEWKKVGRSFYTHQKFATMEQEAKNAPPAIAPVASASEIEEEHKDHCEDIKEVHTIVREKKQRRADENRLCKSYVLPFLRALYHTEFKPKEYENAFVVQDQRPSTDFRNVDLIAVHWRTTEIAELITVEAKLGFTSQLVQQAANYSRFSHRVWLAVVVEPGIEVEEIVSSLKEEDELLFEYVLSLGLGIIACQKGRGGSFNCYAVQWPRKQQPDNFEKICFMECYRETFEEAGLLERQKRNVKIA